MAWKASMTQGLVYIRERLPYRLSCDVRAHKLVFKDHCLSDQLEALCGITTKRSVTV